MSHKSTDMHPDLPPYQEISHIQTSSSSFISVVLLWLPSEYTWRWWKPAFLPHCQPAMDLAIQFILQLTPFTNIHAMDDYADVLAYLVEYWEWDIDAYRTYLKYALVTTYIAVTSTLSMQPEHSHRQRIHSALCTGVSHHGRVLTLALQWIDSRGVAGKPPFSPSRTHVHQAV
ncbi:hypothetical protein EDC04DRAFT_165584 [Pisolithus marmoratus]|nr:hypothetical protein EDC04DRAFT_165584 [Pisolithus marmoratus]